MREDGVSGEGSIGVRGHGISLDRSRNSRGFPVGLEAPWSSGWKSGLWNRLPDLYVVLLLVLVFNKLWIL